MSIHCCLRCHFQGSQELMGRKILCLSMNFANVRDLLFPILLMELVMLISPDAISSSRIAVKSKPRESALSHLDQRG